MAWQSVNSETIFKIVKYCSINIFIKTETYLKYKPEMTQSAPRTILHLLQLASITLSLHNH